MLEEYESYPEARDLGEFPEYDLDFHSYEDWVKIENEEDEGNTEWIKMEERYVESLERLI